MTTNVYLYFSIDIRTTQKSNGDPAHLESGKCDVHMRDWSVYQMASVCIILLNLKRKYSNDRQCFVFKRYYADPIRNPVGWVE